MASTKEYLDFVLEQLSLLDGVSHRSMMGEYILYYQGKIVGGIYDDRFLVKPTASAAAMLPEAAGEVVRWLFGEIGLDAILCCHFPRNRQSRRVQEKCGFTHYADVQTETSLGTVEDSVVNLLTRAEWMRLSGHGEAGI